jgi:hypothetical protein
MSLVELVGAVVDVAARHSGGSTNQSKYCPPRRVTVSASHRCAESCCRPATPTRPTSGTELDWPRLMNFGPVPL